jgi:hypothetical protein
MPSYSYCAKILFREDKFALNSLVNRAWLVEYISYKASWQKARVAKVYDIEFAFVCEDEISLIEIRKTKA